MRRALTALVILLSLAVCPVALAGRNALTGKGLDPYVPILSTYVPTWAVEGALGFWDIPSKLPGKVPELFSSKFALVVNVAFGLVTPEGTKIVFDGVPAERDADLVKWVDAMKSEGAIVVGSAGGAHDSEKTGNRLPWKAGKSPDQLAKLVVAWMDRYHLDGVSFDIETDAWPAAEISATCRAIRKLRPGAVVALDCEIQPMYGIPDARKPVRTAVFDLLPGREIDYFEGRAYDYGWECVATGQSAEADVTARTATDRFRAANPEKLLNNVFASAADVVVAQIQNSTGMKYEAVASRVLVGLEPGLQDQPDGGDRNPEKTGGLDAWTLKPERLDALLSGFVRPKGLRGVMLWTLQRDQGGSKAQWATTTGLDTKTFDYHRRAAEQLALRGWLGN